MKRLFHAVIFCLGLCASVKAQLQKGTRYFAGTITLDGTNNRPEIINGSPNGTFNSISVNPSLQAGRFIGDNRMIGIGIGGPIYFAWNKNNLADGSTYKYRVIQGAYTLSPYIRHYKSLHSKWAVFLTSSADLAYLNITEKEPQEKRSRNGYSAGVKLVPGVVFWISPRFALESDINLLSLSTGYRDFADNKSFYFVSSVTTGLSNYFSVRASWYIQKL